VLAALGFSIKSEGDALSFLYPIGAIDKPVSLCFSTLPEEDLNNTTMGRNWAEKIIRNLREQDMQWGLLTNGMQWRIYHLDEPLPYETFLEIDLEAILTEQAKEAYQIFHKFMKSENFVTEQDDQCQFDRFKKESKDKVDYIEKELQNALKQREEGGQGVLSDICMGYVEELSKAGNLDLDDEPIRGKIYHGAMLYMFRLLFLFYADARGLLSDDNRTVLEDVFHEASSLQKGKNLVVEKFLLWTKLESIFVDIDQTYNGGLFSPQESEFTQFIEETKIQNKYLCTAIHNLITYKEKDGHERLISYRDMGVRHLGTLYEGLLEHKLYIAEEDTEVKVTKGKVSFIPASKGGRLVVGQFLQKGSVYFAGDPTERKATGSYYTPEYIVDYIVRNTVGEKLKELRETLATQEMNNLTAFSQAIDEDERKSIAAIMEENQVEFVSDKVLRLSVLDPAMGSGHFLVNTTNLISNKITELLNDFGITGDTPTGTAYWRRWVVENCIYGVDLNPLAVELGKLSLWILSMARNQPLSFMNHHLKCGNSLVGSTLEEIGNYPLSNEKKPPKQIHLFESDPDFKIAVETAIEKSDLIANRSSTSLLDVEEKKAWLEEIEHSLAGYKAISNIHTGLYFDSHIDETTYDKIIQEKNFSLAYSLQSQNKYFHWSLEFPEIFFSNQGFSCVVSNPPYDTLRENKYFQKNPASGSRNLFSHFIVKAIENNHKDGNLGFVVPLSFACGSTFEKTRQQVFRNYRSLHASHYSKRPNMLFDGVQQRITIFYSLKKSETTKCKLHSSKLWRWQKRDQELVVRNPQQNFVGNFNKGVIPKVHTSVGADIYNYIMGATKKLDFLFSTNQGNNKSVAYYHSVSMYWIKAYDFVPHFSREDKSKPAISTKLKKVVFQDDIDKYIFLLMMNSSLFYYWWISISNEFDVQVNEIRRFGLYGYDKLRNQESNIKRLVTLLMKDYQKHSAIKTTRLGGKLSEYQEFYPRKSKNIINEIDDFIAPIYGISQEQNIFLKNFDIEWRTD